MTIKELKEKLEILIEDGHEDCEIIDKYYNEPKLYVVIETKEVWV